MTSDLDDEWYDDKSHSTHSSTNECSNSYTGGAHNSLSSKRKHDDIAVATFDPVIQTHIGKQTKFYAVRIGVRRGIYNSWDECKLQIHKYSGAKYKSFNTFEEATRYMDETPLSSPPKHEKNGGRVKKTCELAEAHTHNTVPRTQKTAGDRQKNQPSTEGWIDNPEYETYLVNTGVFFMGFKWFGTEQGVLRAIANLPPEKQSKSILLKLCKNKKFGYKNRQHLACAVWALKEPRPPIYEVIEQNKGGPKRLYFDIESEFSFTTVPDGKAWFVGLLEIITTSIKALQCVKRVGPNPGATHFDDDKQKVMVANNSRATEAGFKFSFHLVFPHLFFDDHATSMVTFIRKTVVPLMQTKKHYVDYTWLKQTKKGVEVRTAADPKPYSKRQPYRVTWACKDGEMDGGLRPWDPITWISIKFEDETTAQEWFDQSLVSHSYDDWHTNGHTAYLMETLISANEELENYEL
jgi:hypothetical protein